MGCFPSLFTTVLLESCCVLVTVWASSLFITQDSMGDLFFHQSSKSLLELPFVAREINRQSLFHYLSLHYIPGSNSIIDGIYRLPPAHYLEYSLQSGSIRIKSWWEPSFKHDEDVDEAEWPEIIRSAFFDAVGAWCRGRRTYWRIIIGRAGFSGYSGSL